MLSPAATWVSAMVGPAGTDVGVGGTPPPCTVIPSQVVLTPSPRRLRCPSVELPAAYIVKDPFQLGAVQENAKVAWPPLNGLGSVWVNSPPMTWVSDPPAANPRAPLTATSRPAVCAGPPLSVTV